MTCARDYEATAKRYRDQTEEFRAKASLMSDMNTRGQYDNIADAFEKLAENDEIKARNMDRAAE